MLTPDQLAAIAEYTKPLDGFDTYYSTEDELECRKHLTLLLADYERLTRHNQRMSAALAQLSDIENWGKCSMEYVGIIIEKSMWNGVIDPQQLAERALVEDR